MSASHAPSGSAATAGPTVAWADAAAVAAVAAVASFVPFTLGAAVPVVPFAFLSGTAATVTSVAASAAGLFLLGSAITLLTRRSVVRAGVRQLAIGLAAAAVTFAIGRLVGVQIT